MAPKHQNEGGDAAPEAKKPKHGFRVGPENLPDGPWRRKGLSFLLFYTLKIFIHFTYSHSTTVTKVKKELIHKAKIKKAYAKIKAREQQNAPAPKISEPVQDEAPVEDASEEKQPEEEGEEMHPTRQLMLADEAKAQNNSVGEPTSDGNRRRTRRPGYYDKQLAKAAQRQEEAEMKRREFERRQEERAQKIAERQKFKKAMAKTRDRNGNKKLGRESSILLDKVRKLVAEK
jgi:type IV secretory pathway VirB10-like protein